MNALTPHDAETWRGQLARFLPTGRIWQVPEGGAFDGLLSGLAEEYARADARISTLLEEADPRTTLELLIDWERAAALPDACTGTPDTIAERQAAVVQKIATRGGQSIAYFTDVAALLGYPITIEEVRPFEVGDEVGSLTSDDEWRHVWFVHIRFDGDLPNLVVAKVGDSVGVRVRDWGMIDLECIIGRLAPAHSIVLFSYEE